MRLSPPLSILALVGVCLIALSVERQSDLIEQAHIRRAQCDVALSYLTRLKAWPRKPWLLLEQPERVASLETLTSNLAQNPEYKNDPEFNILVQQARTADLSPVKLCLNVQKWVLENRVRVEVGEELKRDSVTPDWLVANKNDEYDWHIIRVSMPAITADRSSAYMNVSEYFGPLGGSGHALEYKKQLDGSWKLHKRVGRYIS